MTGPRQGQRRGRRQSSQKPRGLWSPTPALPDPEPIKPANHPAALVESLGPPPLLGHSTAAEHHIAAVVERAVDLATALATAAGVLDARGLEE
jgi:hypothetical protein